ncbi:hypothetical protein ACLKA6_014008, partial [Drosophila palustris]
MDQPNSSRAATMAGTEARGDVGLGRDNEVVEEQAGKRPSTDEPERKSSEMQAEWPANPGPELKEEAELIASVRARIAEEAAQISAYPETDDQPGWNLGYRADYEGNQTERRNSAVKTPVTQFSEGHRSSWDELLPEASLVVA